MTPTAERVVPAINEIELWQQVGQQPYEMTWVERAEHPKTLVDFEDLQGWQKARQLTNAIYDLTGNSNFCKRLSTTRSNSRRSGFNYA